MTEPTRRERTRPLELLGLSAVLAIFTGLVVLMSTRDIVLALIFAGIAFIVALVVLAMLALAVRPTGDEQLDLRAADNLGSGLPANAGHLDELRSRIYAELAAGAPLTLRDLDVRGDDLTAALDLAPGPVVGDLLDHLLQWVLDDPARNERDALIAEAGAQLDGTRDS